MNLYALFIPVGWLCTLVLLPVVEGYCTFVMKPNSIATTSSKTPVFGLAIVHSRHSATSLQMVDQQLLMGGAIGITGLLAGIGLVAFTEQQGERAKARGGGISDTMATRIAGQLMEDVEVSTVSDIGSLTSQLEEALRQSGATDEKELAVDEEELKRIASEADDGW
jgi:hypothetical protein